VRLTGWYICYLTFWTLKITFSFCSIACRRYDSSESRSFNAASSSDMPESEGEGVKSLPAAATLLLLWIESEKGTGKNASVEYPIYRKYRYL